MNELDYRANATPSYMGGLNDIYQYDEKEKLIAQQMAQAKKLRDHGVQPKGAGVGPYNVYVAPNIMQNTAAMLSDIKGQQGERSAMEAMSQNLRARGEGNMESMRFKQDMAKKALAELAAQKQAQEAQQGPGDMNMTPPTLMGDAPKAPGILGGGAPAPRGPVDPGSLIPPGMNPADLNVGVHPVPPPGMPGMPSAGPSPLPPGVKMYPSHKPFDPNDPDSVYGAFTGGR
jgi:hypothetical protein